MDFMCAISTTAPEAYPPTPITMSGMTLFSIRYESSSERKTLAIDLTFLMNDFPDDPLCPHKLERIALPGDHPCLDPVLCPDKDNLGAAVPFSELLCQGKSGKEMASGPSSCYHHLHREYPFLP